LINGALGEMARFYKLPNTQAGCLSDAKRPGAQAVMEKVFSALPLVLSGVDVINGTGEIDTSQMLVLEQIVVDHEIACMCKRFKDGIDVSDAKDYMHDIEQVGPGGHFLAQPSTLIACRICRNSVIEIRLNTGRPWAAPPCMETQESGSRKFLPVLRKTHFPKMC